MRDPLHHLGSIWYHSGPLEVPYSPNQFLGWDFFGLFLQETSSSTYCYAPFGPSMMQQLEIHQIHPPWWLPAVTRLQYISLTDPGHQNRATGAKTLILFQSGDANYANQLCQPSRFRELSTALRTTRYILSSCIHTTYQGMTAVAINQCSYRWT